MNQITIRQAREEDYSAIYEVNTAAFAQDNEARLIRYCAMVLLLSPACRWWHYARMK